MQIDDRPGNGQAQSDPAKAVIAAERPLIEGQKDASRVARE